MHFYLFDTLTSRWEVILDSSSIEDRTGHCCIPCPAGFLVFGGLTAKGPTSTVLLVNLFGCLNEEYDCHDSHSQTTGSALLSGLFGAYLQDASSLLNGTTYATVKRRPNAKKIPKKTFIRVCEFP